MSERIISNTPCPFCHGTGKREEELCGKFNGTGNVPVYEDDPDYPPSDD